MMFDQGSTYEAINFSGRPGGSPSIHRAEPLEETLAAIRLIESVNSPVIPAIHPDSAIGDRRSHVAFPLSGVGGAPVYDSRCGVEAPQMRIAAVIAALHVNRT